MVNRYGSLEADQIMSKYDWLTLKRGFDKGCLHVQGWLSGRRKFTPVPSRGSAFVYITTKWDAGASYDGVSSPR